MTFDEGQEQATPEEAAAPEAPVEAPAEEAPAAPEPTADAPAEEPAPAV